MLCNVHLKSADLLNMWISGYCHSAIRWNPNVTGKIQWKINLPGMAAVTPTVHKCQEGRRGLFGQLLGSGRNAISNPGVDWFWPFKMVNNLHEPSWTNWFWHGELSKPTIDLSSAFQFWVELIDLGLEHLAKTGPLKGSNLWHLRISRLHSSSSSAIWVHDWLVVSTPLKNIS